MQKVAVNPKTVTSDLTWRLARYAYFTGSPPGGSDADKAKWKVSSLITLVLPFMTKFNSAYLIPVWCIARLSIPYNKKDMTQKQ